MHDRWVPTSLQPSPGLSPNAGIRLANITSISFKCRLYDTRECERWFDARTLHILIMNSGTIWASHSGLVRQGASRGFPIHDRLIGKPVLSPGPIFMWRLSSQKHSLLRLGKKEKKKIITQPYPISQQSGNALNDTVAPQQKKKTSFG